MKENFNVCSPPVATIERERDRANAAAVDERLTCEGKGGNGNGNNSFSDSNFTALKSTKTLLNYFFDATKFIIFCNLQLFWQNSTKS